jgi:class 3 adenylate cyclase/tetratricopeptide (TPR) repeat protein
MRCASCGGDTPEGKPFCANCGVALARSCTNCGAALLEGKPFCADCGTPVTAAEPAAAPTPSAGEGAERRLCSVLFVDLVGFTPLAEHADPEEVRELLLRYFARAEAIIGNYGGTVEKFIGDAVVALWGAPVANEDDAERAVRAGLDVVAGVAALGREVGREGLAARSGIVTGEVAVSVGRIAEGMVTGDTVNAASRVQGAAEPGTVLVDEATWRASSGAIAYEEVGALALKGKSESVTAWRALRVVGQRKGLGRAEQLEPPFVGRDDELSLVKDLLHATQRERRARLVSVTGVPGIGKSRLAWEFVKYVDGLAETVYWHQGRSATYGAGVTFGALGEMVRMRAGINETEDADTARAQLAASVAEYVADEDERRWITPRLAHLLGLADAPTGDRDELFGAWRTFFQRIAELGVTVLVFEDLQWADAGLIDFIESILEWSRDYPIMVVTLARPELRDQRPDWGAGQRSFTSLHLDPLTDDEMTTLLEGFVEGLPAHVVAGIRERAEGVPLYAVETVRMLVDRGVLVAEGSGYRLDGELDALEIPETLHALVASRLDALPAEQRRLLQDAAVLGTTFHPDTLAAVQGVDRDALEPLLRDLVRKEFVRLETDPRSPERGQYHFVQAVVGDVALGMLSHRDRSARHLAVARHFETQGDDELTAVVAAQYASALRSAPEGADRDALGASAATWLRRAGDRALSLASPEQALDWYDQALEVTADEGPRAALLELAGEAASRTVDPMRADALLRAAIDLHTAAGDRDGVGRSAALLATALGNERRYAEAAELAEHAYLELGAAGSPKVRAQLANAIASSYGQGLDLHKSLEWCETALTVAEQLGESEELARGLGTRSLALFSLGRQREALMLARGMAQLAEDAGAQVEQARALLAASLYVLPDDPAGSLRASADAAVLAARVGHRSIERTTLLNEAETAITIGEWDVAREVLTRIDPVEMGGIQWVAGLRAMLAALTGDAEGATTLLARTEGSGGGQAFVAGETTILHASSVVALALGDLDRAWRDARRALELDPVGINASVAVADGARAATWARDHEGVRWMHDAGRSLRGRWVAAVQQTIEAGVAALEDRRDEAAAGYRVALDGWRALDCPLQLALAGVDAALLLGPDALPEATAEAEAILTRLGATTFLDRLSSSSAAPR